MAILRPGGVPRRPFSLRGIVNLVLRQGQVYARKWRGPRHGRAPRYELAMRRRWSIVHQALQRLPLEMRQPLEDALRAWLTTHGGLRASGAIRLRDWLHEILTGRMWAIDLPDGRTLWSAAVVRDCSDFLDLMEPRIGSLLVRTNETWLTTVQCRPGGVLTSMGAIAPEDACPPASLPPANEAIGGY